LSRCLSDFPEEKRNKKVEGDMLYLHLVFLLAQRWVRMLLYAVVWEVTAFGQMVVVVKGGYTTNCESSIAMDDRDVKQTSIPASNRGA
jgi:hypothetical protein